MNKMFAAITRRMVIGAFILVPVRPIVNSGEVFEKFSLQYFCFSVICIAITLMLAEAFENIQRIADSIK